MKIIIVGATGTLGSYAAKALEADHELIQVGYSDGDYRVDISDVSSIRALYANIGQFDALIATTGKTPFKPIADLNGDDLLVGINNKLMGQMNLVLEGLPYIREQGSFTLTSGILNGEPIKGAAPAAMVNGAIEGFVRSAAVDMPKGVRINVVSPTLVHQSVANYAPLFRGYEPIDATIVAKAFVRSVEGLQTGQIMKVGW